MKYLSFITVLILLATLFSFVFTQLNKDETKHEYGIAFPLEESESRLPALSSVIQLEADAKAAAAAANSQPNVESLREATTTTDTVATSPKTTEATQENTSGDVSKSSEELGLNGDSDGSSIVIEALPDSSNGQNDTDADGSKDSSEESGDGPTGSNPKLVFIERLMGMNFQRSPSGGFSSFLEMRGEGDSKDEDKNKTESSGSSNDDADGSKDGQPELPWLSNSLDNIRSRWESRLRKFTFPFQNSYSVVLRASSVAADPSASESSKDSPSDSDPLGTEQNVDIEKPIKPVDVPQSQSSDASSTDGPKFFFQSAGPLSPLGQSSAGPLGSGQNPHTNQLLRMAALSMMSKLFTALRNQAVYSNPKMDSGSSRFAGDHSHHDGHDLDLDDDDDDNEVDTDRTPEGMPVPIIIAHRPKMNVEGGSPYGYGNDDQSPPMRTSVMYGRPAPAAAQQAPIVMTQRFFGNSQAGPVSPLAAILAAAAARQRRMEATSMPVPQESQQPQRLILLITHPREESPLAPRVQMISRDDQHSYQPSSLYNYAPLSNPSSPIYYHVNPSAQAAPQMVAQTQHRPQIVEVPVPVPVYVPMMMRMGRSAAVGPAPIRPRVVSRMMPAEPRSAEPSGQTGPGHVALLYVHSPDSAAESPNMPHESMVMPHHVEPASPAQSEPESPTGFVRILLRPKMNPAAAMSGRLAFHRRLDESTDDEPTQVVSSPMIAAHHSEGPSMMEGARLRQWRDYSQFVRSAPVQAGPSGPQGAPVAHLLIAAGPSNHRDDSEPASSEEHYQHFAQPHPQQSPMSPFFFHHPQVEAEGQQQQQPHPLMMAAAQGPAAYHHPAAQQQPNHAAGPHAAFFILAEPNGAQSEAGPSNSNDA